jgi:hypothetical protein
MMLMKNVWRVLVVENPRRFLDFVGARCLPAPLPQFFSRSYLPINSPCDRVVAVGLLGLFSLRSKRSLPG